MPNKKLELGQFFTVNDIWKSSAVANFIGNPSLVVDPFAGNGDLLKHFSSMTQGYDIDASLGWYHNDSLRSIPRHDDAVCVTNPPYLSKNSATRKKLTMATSYFVEFPKFEDLYEIAINRCLHSFDKVVAIIPETFTTTNRFKERLVAVDILEDNPFADTECPVLVGCWGKEPYSDFDVYKNGSYIAPYSEIHGHGAFPKQGVSVRFNVKGGNLGLIGIDGTGADNKIRFCDPSEISDDEIKVSSRARSKIQVDTEIHIERLIERANAVLVEYRNKTADICLSPFKNNAKDGSRRRRLDFALAKGMIYQALNDLSV